MALNLAEDWRKFHFLEEISYSQRIDDGSFYPAQTFTALKRDTQKKFDDFSTLETAQIDGIWQTWNSAMTTAIALKRGDMFVRVADNTTWEVMKVDYWVQTTLWVMYCYQLVESVEVDEVGFLLLEDGGGIIFG